MGQDGMEWSLVMRGGAEGFLVLSGVPEGKGRESLSAAAVELLCTGLGLFVCRVQGINAPACL